MRVSWRERRGWDGGVLGGRAGCSVACRQEVGIERIVWAGRGCDGEEEGVETGNEKLAWLVDANALEETDETSVYC